MKDRERPRERVGKMGGEREREREREREHGFPASIAVVCVGG